MGQLECLHALAETGRQVVVSATQPGKGKFVGEMTIEAGATPDEFSTTTKLTS